MWSKGNMQEWKHQDILLRNINVYVLLLVLFPPAQSFASTPACLGRGAAVWMGFDSRGDGCVPSRDEDARPLSVFLSFSFL